MATEGPNFSTSSAQETYTGISGAWSNLNNSQAEDGSFATATSDVTFGTEKLVASGFGWTIPAGSTLTNLLAEAKVKSSTGTPTYNWEYGQNNGSNNGSGSGIAMSTTLAWTTFFNGAPNAMSTIVINNTDAYRIYAPGGAAYVFSVDAFRITYTYTPPGQPSVKRTAGVQFMFGGPGTFPSIQRW